MSYTPAPLPVSVLLPLVDRALAEDFGTAGDLTANLLVPEKATNSLVFRARDEGVFAGHQLAKLTFASVDPAITYTEKMPDGSRVKKGDIVATVKGPVKGLLMAERTALNFMGRMCGIATLTSKYVDLADGNARIAATRKTTPGLRAIEKYAVLCGGGFTHRESLSSAIMIKDNHIALAGGIEKAMAAIKARADHMAMVSCEVDALEQLEKVLPYEPHVVLLDNMKPDTLRKAVAIVDKSDSRRPTLEASGGVNLSTVAEIAKTGIDVISVGALTHSAINFDIGLDEK